MNSNKQTMKRTTTTRRNVKTGSSITITTTKPASPHDVEEYEPGLIDLTNDTIAEKKVEIIKSESESSEEEELLRKVIQFKDIKVVKHCNGNNYFTPEFHSFIKYSDAAGGYLYTPESVNSFEFYYNTSSAIEIACFARDRGCFGVNRIDDSYTTQSGEVETITSYSCKIPFYKAISKTTTWHTITWFYHSKNEILYSTDENHMQWYDIFKSYFYFIIYQLHKQYEDAKKETPSMTTRALVTQKDEKADSDDDYILDVPLPASGKPIVKRKCKNEEPTMLNALTSFKNKKRSKSQDEDLPIRV